MVASQHQLAQVVTGITIAKKEVTQFVPAQGFAFGLLTRIFHE